ncbi:unnamed protein product [Clonostachys rhizophaga]|uniref:G domain-containing protein n=1 Tax=Clonostachys rhizophaga TaxID=160324 RepID=A0A9N9YPF6_9HYPO|nr:unnamed protein product [Clonostachys rhizophaga]
MANNLFHHELPDNQTETRVKANGDATNTRRWKWSANVVLIGTSQSGKSTLINRFMTLAVGPHPLPDPARIGGGGLSCTTDPFLYELDVPMTEFILVDGLKDSLVDSPDDERHIFDLGLWKRKDLQVRARNSNADIVRLRLLDTPGLDDSEPKKNAKNMEKVLQALNSYAQSTELEKRHISAVIFVVKTGNPFNDSLQKWYHHYQRCMPNLFGSLAVVNTCFRFKDWKTEYKQMAINAITFGAAGSDISSRDKKMKRRREAWAETFKSDPTHFFIDSKPSRDSPFQEYVSVNTIYDILLYLRSQGKMPIENVRLVKLPQMAAIDKKVVEYLAKIQNYWEKERGDLFKSLSNQDRSDARHRKSIIEWENDIKKLDENLRIWDSDVEFDLNTYNPTAVVSTPAKIWKFLTFSGHESTVEIREQIFPFWVDAPNNSDTTWVSKRDASQPGEAWKGQYKSKWQKTPRASLRSYTTNRKKYAQEIKDAMSRRIELNNGINETRDIIKASRALSSQSQGGTEENPRVTQLTELLAQSERLIRLLQEEEVPMTRGFSQSDIRRYGKSIDKICYSDVLELIEEHQIDLKPAFDYAVSCIKRSST